MNITQKSTSDLSLQIIMQVEENDYANEVKKQLNQYRKQANIPGFRPGMVPFGMVKKMYGESVTAETVSKLIGAELDKYLKDQKLEILGQPMPDNENQELIDFNNSKEFTFYYVVGLKPEINLNIDESYKIPFNKLMAQEEDVDKYLDEIRTKMGVQSNPEVVSEGDMVMGIIAELDTDGNIKEDGIKNEKASLSVDLIKLKTIKNKFIGKKVGDEVIFNPIKAFKNDTNVSNLLAISEDVVKGTKSDFQITIAEISHIEKAEMNEDFFSKVYENSTITTESELRARIREDIEKSYEADSDRAFYNDVVEAIIKKTDLNLPDNFLKSWIIESNRREEKDKQITAEELELQYDGYRDSLRWQLLEEHIMVQNDLIIQEEELRNRVKEILGLQAFGGGASEENDKILEQVTESVMQDKEQIKQVSQQIIEQKFIKYFKEQIKPEEVNVSYDDFVEMMKKKTENAKK